LANRKIPQESIQGTGQMFSVPAPFQGLNTRDSHNVRRADEATVLQNFLPDGGTCKVRPGYQLHTSTGHATEALFVYNTPTGRSLLAAANNRVLDVTSNTATQISTTTITKNRWSTVNYEGFIIGANGVDTPWKWNGTTFNAAGFTYPGLTVTNLSKVALVQNRIWFTVNNSAKVYFGDRNAITGPMFEWDLSQVSSGGKCVGIGSWSVAGFGGDGPTDAHVFVMDTGEVIVYAGDPTEDFNVIGKFLAPPPINTSYSCTLKIGGLLVIMTQAGPIPMTFVWQGVANDPIALGPWGKISSSWQADWANFGSNDGWSATYHNGIAYFNIVTGTAKTKQYVFNTNSQAWTTYDGLPAAQFASTGTSIYFSQYNGLNVYLHQGGTDNGAQIVATARQGYSYPVNPNVSKKFTMMKPVIIADGTVQGQFQVDTDFNESPISAPVATVINGTGSTPWGSAWSSSWSSTPKTVRTWKPLTQYGVAVAPVVRLFSTADNARWESSQIMAVPAGVF
jgi:hypothetical protein